ncbi:glycoside hydrolase family 2 protein [Neptunicella sp. SCSIO 80796]|uniref:glycoside hydrolase family 2 protein n=1 Tax=Neptunicella plasticusilytica TaxID=3117012 RepID=UPI003A4D48AE
MSALKPLINQYLSHLVVTGFVLFSTYSQASDLIQNPHARQTTSLNGDWHYIVDPYENGFYNYRYEPKDEQQNPGAEAYFLDQKPRNKSDRVEFDFATSPSMKIPGDWNTQNDKLYYYEGTIWFRQDFDYSLKQDKRLFVHFGAVNYQAHVYLNGKKLGMHEGGFTPFNFEVTDLIKPTGNYLVVKVDNKRRRDAVPTLNTDWWNYGGITRDVTLLETPANYIQDYRIQLQKDHPDTISGYAQLDGENISNQKVRLSIPQLGINALGTTNNKGQATFSLKAKDIQYWSPEVPYLYDVSLQLADTPATKVTDKIGFRSIGVEGDNILLNGKSVFLRGISLHEENPLRGGRAYSEQDARLMLGWVKELGANFVRLAHYPHNENMLKVADEMGILVWEENPVYWTILFDNPATFDNAANQLRSVINRDKNRASVIVWSMANETPRGDSRLNFLKRISAIAREMDDSRLISAALEKHYVKGKDNVITVDDRFADYVDILSFNEYVGWYDGLPDKAATIEWDIKQHKPVFISEFGGGALQGKHGDKMTMWTEEHQEYLYQESLKMLEKIPQLRGMSPWILVDFRSPRRLLPEIQDDYNRKGIIGSNGKKKKAWQVLHDYYQQKAKQY